MTKGPLAHLLEATTNWISHSSRIMAPFARPSPASVAAATSSSSPSSRVGVDHLEFADVWHGEAARSRTRSNDDGAANEDDDCRSIMDGGGDDVKICFRNLGTEDLVVCWVDEKGRPHHFYALEPTSVLPGTDVTSDDAIEHSHAGHAFVVASASSQRDTESIRKSKRLAGANLVGGVRPKDGADFVLVEIHPRPEPNVGGGCCGAFLRRGKANSSNNNKKKDSRNNGGSSAAGFDDGADIAGAAEYDMVVQRGTVDPTPLDTTGKRYVETTLGGWPVRLDAKLKKGDRRLRPLEKDLKALGQRLPPAARDLLRESTPLWINDTYWYGPKACPIQAKACCFHPHVEWLRENGCNPKKAECVEVYDLDDYNDSRYHWLAGGVMLHEYSHAYHFKFLDGGYDNAQIEACYAAAMQERLYDRVGVHGAQGPTARAYASKDPMEYFAELSTAFLGGIDPNQEYNKWFPYNRKQVAEHDPNAYEMLKDVWQVK
jgi:hypothetical protein